MLEFGTLFQSTSDVQLSVADARRRINLFVAMTIMFSLVLGTLFVWDRGLYMDDYYTKRASQDVATGTSRVSLVPLVPYARILGQLVQQNAAAALPTYQLPARILWAGVHLASVLVLGLIVYEATNSSFARTIVIWFFLMPFWACEAILWFTQVGQHGIAALVFLLALYLMVVAIKGHKHGIGIACLAFACVALGLQFSELPVSVVGYPPLLALVMTPPTEGSARRWRRFALALGFTLICVIIGFVHYKLFTGRYLEVSNARGSVSISLTSIAARYMDYLNRFYTATLTKTWGLAITQEVFLLGLRTLAASIFGNALLVLLAMCSALWITHVPLPQGHHRDAAYKASTLTIVGIVWMFTALIPGTLVTGQMLESRMLYIVLAGLAVACTGLVWGCVLLFQKKPSFVQRSFLAVPACVMIFSTITMVGYCQVYKLRYESDMRQMSALQSVVSPQSLQPNTTFIAMKTDFHLVSSSEETARPLDLAFLGIFEVPWAGGPALQMSYKRDDINFVSTNHWSSPMAFNLSPATGNTPATLLVNGTPVPLDEAIAFTYHEGRVVLASPLIITAPDGHVAQTVTLPLAQRYKNEGKQVEPMQVPLLSP